MLFKKIIIIVLSLAIISLSVVKTTFTESSVDEVMVATFFNSYEDQTNSIYVSFDGINFKRISTSIADDDGPGKGTVSTFNTKNGYPYDAYCLVDPSLQYHDGYFWTMAAWTPGKENKNSRLQTMLSYSPDLINWSIPNAGGTGTDYGNIEINVPTKPYDQNGNMGNTAFDCAAPELFIDDDGTGWVVACLGYYGAFNGNPQKDYMLPYIVKIDNLSPGTKDDLSSIKAKEYVPKGTYSDAIPMKLKGATSKNYIDGSIYKENGTYYLSIKRDGIYNEIWKTNRIGLDAEWIKVCDGAIIGYEGPALTHFGDHYYMYGDKLADYPADNPDWTTGTYVAYSDYVDRDWSAPVKIKTYDFNGAEIPNRHGYVLTLKDRGAIDKVLRAYRANYNDSPKVKEFVTGTDNSYPNSHLKWRYSDDTKKYYWYEGNTKQGIYGSKGNVWYDNTERGREIFDPDSNGWYWLDARYYGAKAEGKEVFMPYIYSDEDSWINDDKHVRSIADFSDTYTETNTTAKMSDQVYNAIKNKTGKWVRYDANGKMIKGWYTVEGDAAKIYPNQAGNTYYYDYQTGLMAKGLTVIDGVEHYFDEVTGAQQW